MTDRHLRPVPASCGRDVSRAAAVLVDVGLRLSEQSRRKRCRNAPQRPGPAALKRRQPLGAPAGTQRTTCTNRRAGKNRSADHRTEGGATC